MSASDAAHLRREIYMSALGTASAETKELGSADDDGDCWIVYDCRGNVKAVRSTDDPGGVASFRVDEPMNEEEIADKLSDSIVDQSCWNLQLPGS